ncbi:MAG: hypothetical protein N3C60_06080 [Calditerrivibrio sp.]|nr:hypothetical protein [Calditerrivibrio sp.]
MKQKSTIQKLGYTPSGRLYKALVGEYRWFLGDYLSFKSIVYYGGKVEFLIRGRFDEVEYYNLYRTVETSVLLNPYNEDIYYFAQATFTWDIGRVREVNRILEYVFKYRSWDFKIPFYLGFNNAYFLKDYKTASVYYQKASELSGSPLFANLAARYLYEGGETALGISYLKTMIKMTRKEEIKKQYETRLKALEAIYEIEIALKKYQENHKDIPTLERLVELKYLTAIPVDPYGGKFYIDDNGKVRTTSKMAFLSHKN